MKDYEIDYKKLYEEEHKKYEDALGRARGHHSVAIHYNNEGEIQELEHIFPELKEKESEDEKIRKSIIKLLQVGGYMSPEDKDKAFAWLKGHDGKKWIYEDVYLKEKEQVFQDGIDEVLENPQKYGLEKQEKDNMGISEVTRKELEDNLNKALEKETPESWNKFLDEQGEQKEQEMQDGLKSDNTVF